MTKATKEFIIKNRKTICGFLIILILFEFLIVFIMIQNYKENYLSQEDAISAVMNEMNITKDQVTNLESEFDTNDGTAWFEITFIHNNITYNYKVDAESGAVTPLN